MKIKLPEEQYGQLFYDVQQSGIFEDSKTFVDCQPKIDIETINALYKKDKESSNFDLKSFVLQYFELPLHLVTQFESDTNDSVTDHINKLWPYLRRSANTDQNIIGSLIPLPYPYIVPGGRFGEIYYWDSYFTMLGLEIIEDWDSIKGMVDNFANMIDEIGFIPNGNRNYFTTRSQPPFFALMVSLLGKKDKTLIANYIPQIEKEYHYWTQPNKCFDIDGYKMSIYWDESKTPRQESYLEDYELVEHEMNKEKIYHNLRIACASGWDFSSRWMKDVNDLKTLYGDAIAPVDLNSLLFQYEILLAQYSDQPTLYAEKAASRKKMIQKYFFNKKNQCFSDFNLKSKTSTNNITAAAFFPLFFNIANQTQADVTITVMQKQLMKDGGLLTSPIYSGQQWDAPNGWAPLQWIGFVGLKNYGFIESANILANKWLQLNESVFKSTGKMMEKYNVVDLSLDAGGGEYPVQDGFGWTNGVYLALKHAIK